MAMTTPRASQGRVRDAGTWKSAERDLEAELHTVPQAHDEEGKSTKFGWFSLANVFERDIRKFGRFTFRGKNSAGDASKRFLDGVIKLDQSINGGRGRTVLPSNRSFPEPPPPERLGLLRRRCRSDRPLPSDSLLGVGVGGVRSRSMSGLVFVATKVWSLVD
jgi:hypothetical protein